MKARSDLAPGGQAARWGAWFVVGLGTSVLIGWIANIPLLMAILPGRITMKPNTAIGFICSGLALLCLGTGGNSRARRLGAIVFSAIVVTIGLLTSLEYLFHFNLRIDELFFRDLTQYQFPGRMAHIAALNFCLAGLSVLLLSISRKYAAWSQVLALLTGLSALLAIIGYIYGVPLLYGSIQYTSMALHTGVGFLVLAGGILHCQPTVGIMSIVSNSYAGGWLSRRLIPVAVLAPVVLGAICAHSGPLLKDARLGLASLVVGLIALFVVLIWVLAFHLNYSEARTLSVTEVLNKTETSYRNMFEEAIIGIFQTTPDGKLLNANPAMSRMFGYQSEAEMLASTNGRVSPLLVDPKRHREFTELMEQQDVVRNFEIQAYRKDGSTMWISANAKAVTQDGKTVRYDGTLEDVTERKSLENQLRQSQKMEAIGRLAGGVAHDFNNALGVIVGYSALLKERLATDATAFRYAEEVGKAGERAAVLTRQLLAFSRKQVTQPAVIDLNSVITETEKMLRRLIGEDVEVTIVRGKDLGRVRADLGQIDQILMNLAVNARDAMPQGGSLIIETANAELDETNLGQYAYAKPGSYVMLSVSDTGCGMSKETQAHIFEPFFTTKAPGQGTGLGLSMVYGIVKQSEGYIWVYSEPGAGARFKIYLPRIEASAQGKAKADDSVLPRGSETILLVEDDEAMRKLTCNCLESSGYTVLAVSNGEAAIKAVNQYQDPIHLLLTDVVMRGINGRQLAESLVISRPGVRVLYISGYTADVIAQRGILEPDVVLLEKPFTREALLRKVRRVLDGEQLANATTAG
jgi:two-component system, cell cycle sensor histidine kinase and response regulator CckA